MIVCDQPAYKGGTIRFYPDISNEQVNPVTYSGGGGNFSNSGLDAWRLNYLGSLA